MQQQAKSEQLAQMCLMIKRWMSAVVIQRTYRRYRFYRQAEQNMDALLVIQVCNVKTYLHFM